VVTTDVWSTDDPGVAGECRYPVGKARNSTRCHTCAHTHKTLFSYWCSCYEETVQCQHLIFWPQSDDSLLSHCESWAKSWGLSTGSPSAYRYINITTDRHL